LDFHDASQIDDFSLDKTRAMIAHYALSGFVADGILSGFHSKHAFA
jgi:hypothetical protein